MELLMVVQGIKILDVEKDVISVNLSDILEEIQYGSALQWLILFSDVIPLREEADFIASIEKLINESREYGFKISWEALRSFSKKILQSMELTIIGCADINFLHPYSSDKEMYKNCDIVIDIINGWYWEIFSKDPALIAILSKRFKKIEFLDPDEMPD